MPCSGKEHTVYGGATSCVAVKAGGRLLVLDAGSGIAKLGSVMTGEKEAVLLLSHTHLDHVMGLCMCPALFDPEFHLSIYGADYQGESVRAQLEKLYSQPLWPVAPDMLPAQIGYAAFTPREGKDASVRPGTFYETLHFGGVTVEIMEGVHPNGVRFFRLNDGHETLVYMTDCTITEGVREAMLDFAKDADILLIDGQYTDEEFASKQNFGHNSRSEAVRFARDCGARALHIIHHDPSATDRELAAADKKLQAENPNYVFGKELGGVSAQSADTRQFVKMCMALSGQRDREKLLSDILDSAMKLNNCDAGTLYLLQENGLAFVRMVTKSLGIRQGGHAAPISLPPVPLEESYVCSYCVLHNEVVRVDKVREDTRFDFSGSKRYDEMTGYFTGTMLVVPLANDRNETIGVIQLLNALDAAGNVVKFSSEKEQLSHAMASIAAISLTNMQYAEQITALLDSLVGALSTAIDERTPYNANHTRNMVKYGERFTAWLDKSGSPFRFDEDRRRSFLLSIWLHDVGKLVVPLEVMDKQSRLGDKIEDVRSRFRIIGLLSRIGRLEGRISAEEAESTAKALADGLQLIESVNTAGFLPDETLAELEGYFARTYVDEDGVTKPWLTEVEQQDLSIRKGTLSAEERTVMESHVSVTAKILSHVFFPKIYSQVPVWASAHHELLNGKGYPDHLTAESIPWEVRLLTILDIFDALTARDRPYKKGMPVEKALSILQDMAEREGSIDKDILDLFIESKVWEENQ